MMMFSWHHEKWPCDTFDHFATESEAAGMKFSTSKYKALSQKIVGSSLRVREKTLPLMEELKIV